MQKEEKDDSARVQLVWGGEIFPCDFLKIEKAALNLEKSPGSVHPIHSIKFLILNAVLRVSRRKTLNFFPGGPTFYLLQMKYLSKCPYSNESPLP